MSIAKLGRMWDYVEWEHQLGISDIRFKVGIQLTFMDVDRKVELTMELCRMRVFTLINHLLFD